jgi:NAD(P)-dependent dehydrogenase (short-subunit alcohol dehydrogenase family)
VDLAHLYRLDNRTAFVTGASYGLGVTFAEALASAGANVVLAARSLDKLRDVEARLTAGGANAVALQCDVTDPAQVESAIAAGWERFGRIDILVNNAGQSADGGAVPENIPHEAFEQTVRVNLLGTWYCCREVGRRMLADGRGGSIINMASIGGLGGVADFPSAYQASKAAVINLTRNLACSWADRGVRVNALAPGWFPSEMTAMVLGHPAFRKWAEQGAAMARLGDPQELVGPLLFLASAASSFVTGHTLVVDGGTSAAMGVSRFPDEFTELLAEHAPGGVGRKIRPTCTGDVAAD